MNRAIGIVPIMLAIAVAVFLAAGPSAFADEAGVPLPAPAKAFKGEQCVEPVADMRRYHMVYLKHQRDETMHKGIRGAKHSLKACVDCHAVADPAVTEGKVRTLKPFCAECHAYAAVSIDCFSCHTPVADDKPQASSLETPAADTRDLVARLQAIANEGSPSR